eukprot:8108499-Karenia_brevis.AAC.1
MREDASKFPSDWDPADYMLVDRVIYDKYKTELYGVHVSLTSGEPINMLRGIQDTKYQYDGFKALVVLSQRLDLKASR